MSKKDKKESGDVKKIIALVVAAPLLALFAGVGVLAFGIAETWDQRNTDHLISNITTVCGISGVGLAVTLAGLVFAVLAFARWRREQEMWNMPGRRSPKMLPGGPGNWQEMPPLPEQEEPKGMLYSNGVGNYQDLNGDMFAVQKTSNDMSTVDGDWRF